MSHIKLNDDETYDIKKVKKERSVNYKIHLSQPITPVMARRRRIQNEILELEARKDRYILRFRKKRYALFQKMYLSSDEIERGDLTEEELELLKRAWRQKNEK